MLLMKARQDIISRISILDAWKVIIVSSVILSHQVDYAVKFLLQPFIFKNLMLTNSQSQRLWNWGHSKQKGNKAMVVCLPVPHTSKQAWPAGFHKGEGESPDLFWHIVAKKLP